MKKSQSDLVSSRAEVSSLRQQLDEASNALQSYKADELTLKAKLASLARQSSQCEREKQLLREEIAAMRKVSRKRDDVINY
jgi:chromosome segregation ATPase